MADRLVAIRKLLTHVQEDRRCAAAIVLAELGADDARTLKALRDALGDEDPDVRRYAVEALGKAEDADSVDEMLAMLNDRDPRAQTAAQAAILLLGDSATPGLQRMLEGPASSRRAAAAMLAKLQTAAGLDMLLEAVDGTDTTVLDRARKALRDKAPALPVQDVRALRKGLDQRLTAARRAGDDLPSAALLALLGDVPDETVVTRIMKETGIEVPPAVRRAALTAMITVMPLARGRRKDAAVEKLLGYLAEDDEDGVTRPALRVLHDIAIPSALSKSLEALVEAPSASVRAYALGHLGQQATPRSLGTLVGQLLSGAHPVREAAKQALSGKPEAAPHLAKALLDTKDPDRLRDVSDLLRVVSDKLKGKDARAACEGILDRADEGDDDPRPMIEAACTAMPEPFLEALRDRVRKKRRGRKLAEAVELLTAAERCPAFGDEERYLLAVLGLLGHAEGKGRALRPNDRVCRPFAQLLGAGFPVETRLVAERSVKTKEIYQLGFAFAESKDEDQRDFGQELLEVVAEREPRTKIGKAAANKLKLSGR